MAVKECVLHWLGAYRRFASVTPGFRARRMIFICKGNVCRSVYAEHYARNNTPLARADLQILSCGLATDGGTPANDMGRVVAADRGVDLGRHASIRVQDLTFDDGDLLVVMEPSMVAPLKPYCIPGKQPQIVILGLLGKPSRPTISDPYGKPKEVFEKIFDRIEGDVQSLARRLT